MIFKDYPYQRPDLAELKGKYEKTIAILRNSALESQLEAIREINKVRNTFQTMQSLCEIRIEINTTDPFYEAEQNFFDENSPIVSGYENDFAKALLESRFRKELEEKFGKQWFALFEAKLKTFRPEIIEDLQEENKLTSEYRKLSASAKIPFDGKILNLSQMGPYSTSSDRDTRRQAETAVMKFFGENEARYDEIYDKLVHVRNRIAKKLGFPNFIELAYLRLSRTDYNANDVANYRRQVLNDLVPLVNEIFAEKAKRLGIENPKSYDLAVDFPSGNPKPIGKRDYLVAQAEKMYTEMSNETGEFFRFMIEHELLDLEAKQNKAGGGFCTYLPDFRSPFIFSNFNGTSGDVDVLTHEAGHAFQVYTSRGFDIPEYTWPTLEACEIHSMSMEFFAWPWMNLFFGDDKDRYLYHHLSGTITFIPYGVLVDHFQHVVYDNPDMTPDERKAAWRKLEKMYMPYKVYENPLLEKGTYWFRQGHIFQVAFYYIDYTLAQVCAQQYWIMDRHDHKKAWESYMKLCRQGGSRSFLNLLEVAGLKNPFKDGTVKMVATELKKYLDEFDKSKLV